VKEFRWNKIKSEKTKQERGISFEEVLASKFIRAEEHTSRENQIILLYEVNGYIWVVPCIEEEEYYFVKTMFPSRKYTKKHKRGE